MTATQPERDLVRRRIRVTGVVQGVGFRPFVFRRASGLGLAGWVRNDSVGVLIEAEGPDSAVTELCRILAEEPPPLARITGISATPIEPRGPTDEGGAPFAIVATERGGPASAPVGIDTAACPACLAEVDDPGNRRHRYAFTNCTDCGPRYTIVTSVPYDRPATTMAGFTMCDSCQQEYDDPTDRRFHAQPNACSRCGPQLRWIDGATLVTGDAALDAAVAALRGGRIVAVKGIGGFHLAVDATEDGAVGELRRRKARDDKPFAVMVADVDAARSLCHLSPNAIEALTSPGRPIVIAPRRTPSIVADPVAPGSPDLGLLLPYTPLHHLVMVGVDRPLVMTSGNLSDEPIAHQDDDARLRLAPLVDAVLTHDRPIHIRCDDSVVRVAPAGALQLLRRSRGYAPEPLRLPRAARRPVLAVGAELKNTVAVTLGDGVVASHHIGDLEHLASYQSFLQAVDHLCRLFAVVPEVVAHDLHPEYLSTKFAHDLDLESCGVQHHHAHIASCMVEHGRTDPVLGLAFDGLGFGPDGTLWGGELLVCDLHGSERVGHLAPVTMPGGAAAIREPWRMGVAWAHAAGLDPPFSDERCGAVLDMVERGQGPTTTSMGRLFDAAAALLGLRTSVTYEAQAAVEMEARARAVPRADAPRYPCDVRCEAGGMVLLDPAPLIAAVLADRRAGVAVPLIAAGFHESIGRASTDAAVALAREHGLDTVALSGGVFQNVRLSDTIAGALASRGLQVLVHRCVPPNDGGICIGQAAVAAARG
ncbi:MAG: carbamoyltransferase HypF [Acidimicrobiales bacterium]